MHHVCHEIVVTFQLLPFKVGLNYSPIWQENFSNTAIVASLHDCVCSHKRIGPSKANDGLSTGLHRIKNGPHWHVALLLNERNGALTVLSSEDLSPIGKLYKPALINVRDDQHTIFSNGDLGVGFRVNLLIHLESLLLIKYEVISKLADSTDSFRVNCGPYSLGLVLRSHCARREQNLNITIGHISDDLSLSRDNSALFNLAGWFTLMRSWVLQI